jgi:molybdopterin converting factor subunit 1
MVSMLVQVRLFAMLRERAGTDSVEIELDDGATVQDALEALAREHDLGELIARMPIVMAVNREYTPEGGILSEGDEVALIPPVSGGDGERLDPHRPLQEAGGVRERLNVHVRVTEEPLSVERVAGMVGRAAAGAIVTFQGTTRDVERLEYEAYREMAEEQIGAIVAEAVERHGLAAAAAEHRLGSVPRGLSSVIVAVSAAHREEAFAAASEIIDRIKTEVPIWKKEFEADEGRWVEGTRAGGTDERAERARR